jgi:hypothetical protein
MMKMGTALIIILICASAALPAAELKRYSAIAHNSRDARTPVVTLIGKGISIKDPEQILNSPGRVVGVTFYDMQSNGSTGNRIALDSNGRAHFVWTNATTSLLTARGIWYGYLSGLSDSLPAFEIDDNNMGGFCSIGILRGSEIPQLADNPVIGYHNSNINDVRISIDTSAGDEIFEVDSLGFGSLPDQYSWPAMAIDNNDMIHCVAAQSNAANGTIKKLAYSHKIAPDGIWSNPVIFDSAYAVSQVISSSRISSKTAIAWTSPIFQDYNQFDNDVVFIESIDGADWNFADDIENITNYPFSSQGDTTLRAYTDLDALYDNNDNLHIVWNAASVTRDSLDEMEVLYKTGLYHWSQSTGITMIYEHPADEWTCDMGAWNLPISKLSMGCDKDSNFIFVVFVKYEPNDHSYFGNAADPNPCGGDNAMPCCNGELYLTWSVDGGVNWAVPINITNTPTPDCLAGDCDNDGWPSLAEVVDDYLHISYIDDKDAGSAVLFEGEPTQNSVIYLRFPNPTRQGTGCDYIPGDINSSGSANGLDVTYGVNFFKGGPPPPFICECGSHGTVFVAGDVNGTCSFNGIDITYMVNYLKGGPAIIYCPDCPPQ